MFYLVEIFRDSSPGDSISSSSERILRSLGKKSYRNFATISLNVKRLLLIKENQISQVKEFSTFLYMGRCRSLGSLKSFLWYAPQLSEARILCFHILSSLKAHQLMLEGYNHWWLWHPYLLTWQEIPHFSLESREIKARFGRQQQRCYLAW